MPWGPPTHQQHRRYQCILSRVHLGFSTPSSIRNIITDQEYYCVHLFTDDSIKLRGNKKIIQGVRGVFLEAKKRSDSLSRGSKVTQGVTCQMPLETPPLMRSLPVARPGPLACFLPPLPQRPPDSLLGGTLRLSVPVLIKSPGPVVPATPLIFLSCFLPVPSTTCPHTLFRLARVCKLTEHHLAHPLLLWLLSLWHWDTVGDCPLLLVQSLKALHSVTVPASWHYLESSCFRWGGDLSSLSQHVC